ncbi:hypothetical protein [Nocardioides aurantiacus]|uniref:hypothetical protein n=1 Tax=Nocardioides aurantiacus TaxID=86796 RepID=UPI00403F1F19
MDQRSRILETAQQLTLGSGRLPSLLEIARGTGLTKQGVLHYFPSRAALDAAVLLRAVDKVDAAMTAAEHDGSPTATYLRLSVPDDEDRAAAIVLAAAARTGGTLPDAALAAAGRWESMMTRELGDPVRAEVARLTGDGLLAEALVTGTAPTADRVERISRHLRDVPAPRP